MALGDPGFYGTNSDDSRNEDYCIYCFAGGEFNEELTMEEMIEQCAEMYAMNSGGKSSPFSDTDTDYRRKRRRPYRTRRQRERLHARRSAAAGRRRRYDMLPGGKTCNNIPVHPHGTDRQEGRTRPGGVL